MRSTYILKAGDIDRKWYVVDAEGHTLGRLASEVVKVLRGKHKPTYQPNMDNGDYVIIINAEKIKVTGKKLQQKIYIRHTGWSGGQRQTPLSVMLQKKPEEVLRHAIKGMLPKNNLGRHMFKKLKVYAAPTHDHQAQQPQPLEIKY